jgi:hypothetical protein
LVDPPPEDIISHLGNSSKYGCTNSPSYRNPVLNLPADTGRIAVLSIKIPAEKILTPKADKVLKGHRPRRNEYAGLKSQNLRRKHFEKVPEIEVQIRVVEIAADHPAVEYCCQLIETPRVRGKCVVA